ncbi:efflux RND transporter permease subunit [Oscillospiraceae bacterium LTW-04]|nr:efflux RND transporter permease subunit [Oscillospiraceae bacterium MB24-C1]
MFSLPNFAVKRPVCMLVCILALFLFGIGSILGMPIESTPEMDMPMMIVMTRYSGASPDEVDQAITERIESSLSAVSGVKSMSSTSSEGSSRVMLEFSYNDDMDDKYQDVTSALSRINLPDDAGEPIVIKMSTANMNNSVMRLSITSDGDTSSITDYIEDNIVPEIEKIEGVGEVSVRGGRNKYISIELMEDRLNQYGLTMSDVSRAIAAAEFEVTMGTANRGEVELSMVGSAKYDTYQALASIPISLKSGDILHISDIADVYMAEQERSSYSRQNGYENISISVTKEQSANTIQLCNQISTLVNEFNANGSLGLNIKISSNSGETIMNNINSVVSSLMMGLIISVLVLFFFFGEWRASLIVGLSMPVSVLAALVLMSAFDITINMMSLGGLVVGIGMMVDNSIVVIESCFRARTEERTFKESVATGANLVAGSVIASTATTVVVFLPISLMDGMAGQLFSDTGFTIVFSITASLISALTLVPLLFMKMKPKEKMESASNRMLKFIDKYYTSLLRKAINARKIVVLVAVVCLVAAGLMFSRIKMEMMPMMDRGDVSLSVETKSGLSLEVTNSIMTEIENIIKQEPDVESYSLSAGGGGGGMFGSSSGSGSISISLKDNRSTSTDDFVNQIREKTAHIQNCSITTTAESAMSFNSSTDVEVNLIGADYNVLKTASTAVKERLALMDGITTTSSSVSDGDPRAKIEVDPILASAVGMTPYSVLTAASSKISGVNAMTYQDGDTTYDVKVEFPSGRYKNISDLYGLMIDTPSGGQISLTDIAQVVYEEGPTSISREDGDYIVTISGTPISGADVTAMTNQAVAIMQDLSLPDGVTLQAGGNMDMMKDEFTNIGYALLTAIFLVFAVMAIQFESLTFALVVMIAIPFSLTGAFFGLSITGSSISMTSLIGLVMLVGIVVNNAIVLIDFTNIMRIQGMEVREAIVFSCRTRMRPILMSTLTTVMGLLPMALGIGGKVEMMQGMSVVVIGGLTLSTVLTLVLIPTFYLMFDKEDRTRRKEEKKQKRESPQQQQK